MRRRLSHWRIPPGAKLAPAASTAPPKNESESPKQVFGRPPRKAVDIWPLLGNPEGACHLADDLRYGENAMNYARQAKAFFADARRARNFTYANSVAMGGWKQRIRLAEVEAVYNPEDEFYGALVRYRKSQYEVAERAAR